MKRVAKSRILTVLVAIWMSFSLEMQAFAAEPEAAAQTLQEEEESAPEIPVESEEPAESVITVSIVDQEPAESVITASTGDREPEESVNEVTEAEEPEEEDVISEGGDDTGISEENTGEKIDPADHYLAFASDLHGQPDTLENAMEGFPQDTEYVSIIGDLVGERGGDAPKYYAEDVYERVRGIYDTIKEDQVSIIWADHDANVVQQGDLVKCEGGYESGQIYEGKNSDGSTAYYIYGVGFYHMRDGGSISQTAANAFKDWIRDKDPTIPALVLCHVPLQAKRGDNLGAPYWNEALNYAATGVEGISTDQDRAEILRNVIYLCGHNHTVDQTEYVFQAGTTMLVQIDPGTEASSGSGSSEGQQASAEGEGGTTHKPHRPKAEGVLSNIFYNSLIPGYLKTSGNATLLSFTDDLIRITKYNGGQQVSLGTDGASGEIMPSSLQIDRIRWGDPGYVWSADLRSATASRDGVNTTALHQSETVATISTVTRAATCDNDGEITYIAVFDNPAFEKQIRTMIIPALGHKCEEYDVTGETAASEEINDRITVDPAPDSNTDIDPGPTADDASAGLWVYLMLAAGIGLTLTKRDLMIKS